MRNSPQKERLRNHIDDYASLLYRDGEWVANDLDGDFHDRQATAAMLLDAGAVRVVDQRMTETSAGKPVHVYEWDEGLQRYLQDYYESRDELPCGHRVHIADTRGAPDGKMPCKFCGELYDIEVIKKIHD